MLGLIFINVPTGEGLTKLQAAAGRELARITLAASNQAFRAINIRRSGMRPSISKLILIAALFTAAVSAQTVSAPGRYRAQPEADTRPSDRHPDQGFAE